MRVFLLLLIAAGWLIAAERRDLEVNANQLWTDTEIYLNAGDRLTISAGGTVELDADHTCGPNGLNRGWGDLVASYPVTNAGKGALIGRFTDNPAARPFLVGGRVERTAPVNGKLFLGINQTSASSGMGSFHVTVEVMRGMAQRSNGAMYFPLLTQGMLDSIPTRVMDPQGNPGDRVNFIMVGSQGRVEAALNAAGWVIVDRSKKEAFLHGMAAALAQEGYVAMPLSDLLLFGRVQDFGYSQGDPMKVAQSRHQFRLWQCPFTLNGTQVWAGAGTHAIGLEKGGKLVTHKIDPRTDGERDYIGQGLASTGFSLRQEYMTATYTVTEAANASGGGFRSDGRTLVIYLQPIGNGSK
jgi:hypothetical protein